MYIFYKKKKKMYWGNFNKDCIKNLKLEGNLPVQTAVAFLW